MKFRDKLSWSYLYSGHFPVSKGLKLKEIRDDNNCFFAAIVESGAFRRLSEIDCLKLPDIPVPSASFRKKIRDHVMDDENKARYKEFFRVAGEVVADDALQARLDKYMGTDDAAYTEWGGELERQAWVEWLTKMIRAHVTDDANKARYREFFRDANAEDNADGTLDDRLIDHMGVNVDDYKNWNDALRQQAWFELLTIEIRDHITANENKDKYKNIFFGGDNVKIEEYMNAFELSDTRWCGEVEEQAFREKYGDPIEMFGTRRGIMPARQELMRNMIRAHIVHADNVARYTEQFFPGAAGAARLNEHVGGNPDEYTEYAGELEEHAFQALMRRPVVIIRLDGDPIIPPDRELKFTYTGDPVFLIRYSDQGHYIYHSLITAPGYNPKEVLKGIKDHLNGGRHVIFDAKTLEVKWNRSAFPISALRARRENFLRAQDELIDLRERLLDPQTDVDQRELDRLARKQTLYADHASLIKERFKHQITSPVKLRKELDDLNALLKIIAFIANADNLTAVFGGEDKCEPTQGNQAFVYGELVCSALAILLLLVLFMRNCCMEPDRRHLPYTWCILVLLSSFCGLAGSSMIVWKIADSKCNENVAVWSTTLIAVSKLFHPLLTQSFPSKASNVIDTDKIIANHEEDAFGDLGFSA